MRLALPAFRQLRLRWLALLAAAGLGSCGGGAVPRPVLLAQAYQPPPALVEADDDRRGFALTFTVERGDWGDQAIPGLWRAPAPWYRSALPVLADEPAALRADDMLFRQAPVRRAADLDEPGTFAVIREPDGEYLFLRIPAGTQPPERAELEVVASAGRRGHDAWRLAAGPLAADGFVLRADAPASFTLDVPPDCLLRFHAVCIGQASGGEPEIVLRLDGEEHGRVPVRPSPTYVEQSRQFTLPERGAPGARLELTVEGESRWLGIFAPRLVPLPDARPEPERPDIVVFLADTFRADNMAFYGGKPGVTPNLDRFAEQSLRFRRAWSTACWTLPSHASLFFGLFPPQHGATGLSTTPSRDLTSIAQRLREAGYRTAAVTDSLYVSRKFELDRGFEHFEEHQGRSDVERTLAGARRLLAEDDGRPLFLFVHSYRAHEPYLVSPRTAEQLGDRLPLDVSWDDLKGGILDSAKTRIADGGEDATKLLELVREGDFHGILELLGLGTGSTVEGQQLLERLRALYLGASHGLDHAFGQLMVEIDARPRPAGTFVVFTSDHGEAFNEHQNLFHGHGIWEENLRIPFLVRGPGLEPRAVDYAASLVDVPQTLAEIAQIAPDPGWLGSSLLSLDEDRPLYAFDCAQRGEPRGLLIEDGLKVVFPPRAEAVRGREIVHAFDLRSDPGERNDLGSGERARTALDGLAEDVLELLKPRAAAGQAELDASDLRAMADMGYTGTGD
ncbi:MAG: sulfatase [Planctomycetota bacterium]